MVRKISFCSILCLVLLGLFCAVLGGAGDSGGEGGCVWEQRVKKEHRMRLVSTEYGEITAVRVGDNIKGSYLLHFFTLEPNSLLLPVILHADMVFYVHTGSGKLSWTTHEGDFKSADIRRGDVYRLRGGSVFFLQSNLETETERRKLRIHAIFTDDNDGQHASAFGPYTNIRDMVLGFDRKVLQAALRVSEEVIEDLFNGTAMPVVIHGVSKTKQTSLEVEAEFISRLLQIRSSNILAANKRSRKKSSKLFNIIKEDKDFQNCHGWSTTVTKKKLSVLKGSNIGVFMVNLTIGSMMGPHWNPTATEVAIVLHGQGMVRVVGPSPPEETPACRSTSFEVGEGDVFVVPRYHPMAQMAFNNDTFVFAGFSTSVELNHPQFLTGQASVLQALDKDVLSISFNVTNTTLDQLLAPQRESVILSCVSCAEEEMRVVEEEREREREEVRKREEEEARKREEEKRREEEEKRKREEEAARKQEEERKRREEEEQREREEEEEEVEQRERKQEEEARKGEEEEARKWEEERKRQEEKARKREEEKREEEGEEERKRQEEEARKREEEAEEVRKREDEKRREEEEARKQGRERKRREEEEEEARKREEEERREEEVERKREEEEARKQEKERKRQEEEEQGEKEEEEARKKQQQREKEEEETRKREEEKRKEEEVARKREEEEARKQEEERERREEEEERKRGEEEDRKQKEEKTNKEEERKRREEGEEKRKQEEERERQEEKEKEGQREEEARKRAEEEQARSREEQERAAKEETQQDEEAQREEEEARR